MAKAPNTTTSLKSITLLPGECFVLPKDAVVESIITDGAIDVTSNCGDLPTPTSYKCGVFYFFMQKTAPDDDQAMEEEHVEYTSVKVGGTTFMINEKVMLITAIEPGTATPVATLNLHITDPALFQITEIVRNTDPADRQRVAVYFKVPENFFDSTTMKISDRGTYYILEPNEATCDEYPEPE